MRFFQQLRGKMTLTYTLVTGGVFLLLWLGLMGLILGLEGVPKGSPLSAMVFDGVVNDIEPYIEADDISELQIYLDLWVSGTTLDIQNEAGSFTATYTDLKYVAVVDANGHIIAMEPQALPLGSPLADHLPPDVTYTLGQSAVGIKAPYEGEPVLYSFIPAAEDHMLVLVFGEGALDTTLQDELITMTAVVSMVLLCTVSVMGAGFGWVASRRLLHRLTHVSQTVSTWSEGNLEPVVRDSAQDELSELGRNLNSMARQLDGLMATRSELAAVEERNRIARDLHDTVKQQIFAASMQLASARSVLHEQPATADSILEQVEALVDSAQTELTGLIHALHPPALADRGVVPALRDYTQVWSERTGISTEIFTKAERRAPLAIEQAIYRVAQEALANVEKHAQATHVQITLSWQAHSLTMDIRDNGRGFDTTQPSDGFGLTSMNDRLVTLNGMVTVESHPGKGTRVTALVELPND